MATWSLAGRHAGPDKPPTPVLCSRKSPPQCAFLFSEEFTGDAAAFFQACADHQLEGIVSKLASSKYRSGRSKTWLKCKCFMESSLIIIGTDRDRKTGALRALLAKVDKHALTYAGAAFIGLRSDACTNCASGYTRSPSLIRPCLDFA